MVCDVNPSVLISNSKMSHISDLALRFYKFCTFYLIRICETETKYSACPKVPHTCVDGNRLSAVTRHHDEESSVDKKLASGTTPTS